jgi:nucleoid DNA-binding protein
MSENNKKALNKTETLNILAERTGLDRKQVGSLLEELGRLIAEQLHEQGPGSINVPGLMRIKVLRKPAQAERTGIHPITKQETVFKAKPARNVVKITPLKGLKDMV